MPRPRPTLFEVRKPTNGKWRIVGFVDGVRKQFWFHSEKEAKQAAKDRNDELIAHGSQVALSPLNRMRSINAAERLAPYHKTIDDAVEFYLKYLKQHSASVPFSALATQVRAEFKRRLEKNEVSERHSKSLSETLRKLETRVRGTTRFRDSNGGHSRMVLRSAHAFASGTRPRNSAIIAASSAFP